MAAPHPFYAEPAPMTALDTEPAATVSEILATARGVIVHEQLCALYGFDRPAERDEELMLRPAGAIVGVAGGLDERPPAERILGNCRQFSVLTVALLRATGVPARARCGFGAAFESDKWVDHWIVEWHDGERWVRSDCQIDDEQRAAFGIDHDPLHLPAEAFLTGGEAWLRCRAGDAEPDCFGIHDMWGLWFVQGNAVADLASLNKVEMLPWDDWGIRGGPEDGTDPEAVLDRVDEIAATCGADDLDAVRALYEAPDLRVPATVQSWYVGGGRIDDVADLVTVTD
ncbi:MAG: transglutaminase-like domain-containing protein [Acidimicrobiia bacterium]|nr:transglutaminase-like domain-containing protein [Acidimicrobiia bacterium]